ncbi:Gfo/Idh/MocA family oxidoreductase [uncultured Draconibacterium sp.]|uniref:Gfo/Idh/MocA family protein n=1 Tax=uncultured Draconibacterium sp. TaxID=1573823 RepID=UPI0025FE696A|nr:Gfo/Idh/MocA family oxidoreductase [uncultured Draconibacterium sp.]
MKRRNFIRNLSLSASGAIMVPTIVKASALGRNGSVAANDRIELVLVGCAGMGSANLLNLLKDKGVECVALCDVDSTRIAKQKAKLTEKGHASSQKEFEDYRELLAWNAFDAAVIAVPDHWHAILYSTFANHKKDVYGEKPLVRKLREGRIVADAVKENNIIWQTGSWQRSTENFAKACELVQSGVLGEIEKIEVGLPNFDKKVGMPPKIDVPDGLNWDLWLGPAPKKPYRGVSHWNWRWIMDYSGGQLTDWIGHHCDIAMWSMDLSHTGPTEIKADAKFAKGDYFDVPHEFDIDAKFENGLYMNIANADKLKHGMGVCWYGEKGWIHVNRGNKLAASDEKLLSVTIPESVTKFRSGNGTHWADFINGVRTRQQPIANVEAAHRAVSVALLGEIAYLADEKLKWDPKAEKLIGASSEANAMLARDYRSPWSLKGL